MYKSNLECMDKKEAFIRRMADKKIKVSVQSVLHRYNFNDNNFFQFPYKLKQLNIKDWYIQRFIPSYRIKAVV